MPNYALDTSDIVRGDITTNIDAGASRAVPLAETISSLWPMLGACRLSVCMNGRLTRSTAGTPMYRPGTYSG